MEELQHGAQREGRSPALFPQDGRSCGYQRRHQVEGAPPSAAAIMAPATDGQGAGAEVSPVGEQGHQSVEGHAQLRPSYDGCHGFGVDRMDGEGEADEDPSPSLSNKRPDE